MMSALPTVTVAVPSFNHARYLDEALDSLFRQELPLEVFVADAGSTDGSLEVIRKWEHRLSGWRSYKDKGQAAAINECITLGTAPYVCWLNSDDLLLPGGLAKLVAKLSDIPGAPAAYGRAWNLHEQTGNKSRVWVRPFSCWWFAQACFISQPASLIRRSAWQSVHGLDENLHMAMDYDLWWRLLKAFGPPAFVDDFIAINRVHPDTKTESRRAEHYREAINVVRTHYGKVPIKWWLAQPYAVWWRSIRR